VSGFAAGWLALREPYDGRARNPAVLDAVTDAFAGRSAIAVVDLACGLGSTLRAISPRLPAKQIWRLVDDDLDLLHGAAAQPRPPGADVTMLRLDLARGLRAALADPIELITASALLDLVSADWLEQLVAHAAERRLPVYVALTYDGRAALEPANANDAAIVAAVNRHQLIDKGFGPALGPQAAAFAAKCFAAAGYALVDGRSDWAFTPQDREIQLEIFAGWADAARAVAAVPPAAIDAWLAARRSSVADGRSSLRVGHVDLFARPIGAR
jgi:hypothetical protein